MSLWFPAVVLALGAALRLTRLVTADDLASPLRRWAAARNETLGLFVACPWCVGFWISLGAVYAAWEVAPLRGLPWWYAVPAATLTVSWLVGLLADIEWDG